MHSLSLNTFWRTNRSLKTIGGRRNNTGRSHTTTPLLLGTVTLLLGLLVGVVVHSSGNNFSYSTSLVFVANISSTPSLTTFLQDKKGDTPPPAIASVSCPQRLTNRRNDTADPNRNDEQSPKKLVNATIPHFWISLHESHFDAMRWAHIYNKGDYYETGITQQFKDILYRAERPGLVIDVGMNIGWFTIYSRAMGHKVAGFDPNPIMHTRLCESLALNGWMDDATVVSFARALGEEAAILNMTTGKNPGGSSFFEGRLAKAYRRKMEVPVVRLDDVAEQQGWLKTNHNEPIYLWKMDVEGYEYHVLGGAQKLLHSGRVENILMENSNKDLRQVVDMYASIYHAGYAVKMISNTRGFPYHPEMVNPLNKALEKSSVGMDLSQLSDGTISFLASANCNILWTKREVGSNQNGM